MATIRERANAGDAQAQSILGEMYAVGKSLPQDYTRAREWYLKAAVLGYARAKHTLGVLYAQGWGVPQDYTQARQWYEQAAAQGEAGAQYNLGMLYLYGKGVPQDDVRAYMWLKIASARYVDDKQKLAADIRDKVARRMTSQQLAEAQRLSQDCQSQVFKGC